MNFVEALQIAADNPGTRIRPTSWSRDFKHAWLEADKEYNTIKMVTSYNRSAIVYLPKVSELLGSWEVKDPGDLKTRKTRIWESLPL